MRSIILKFFIKQTKRTFSCSLKWYWFFKINFICVEEHHIYRKIGKIRYRVLMCSVTSFPSYYHLALTWCMVYLNFDKLLLMEVHALLIFPWFYMLSFSCSGTPSGCHITLRYRASLASHGHDSFSDFSCFGWSWLLWGVLVRYFLECPSMVMMCLMCLLWFV